MAERKMVPELHFHEFDKEWLPHYLKEFLEFQNGFNAGGDVYGSGTALISVMDILNNTFITYDAIRGKANVSAEDKKRYAVEYGDILFQRSSENFEDAGRSNVYLDTEKSAIFGGFVIRGKKISEYNPIFMRYALDASPIRTQITSKAQGAQHINVSQDTLQDVLIRLPELEEQAKVGKLLSSIDHLIVYSQNKHDKMLTLKNSMLEKMFPKAGSNVPEIRCAGFTAPWEQHKFSELYVRVSEKNDLTYGIKDIISVANMYYKPDSYITDPDYLRTYNVFCVGDIAFEGNKSKKFAHGRFVENTIGNGIVSHVFEVLRPITEFDLTYWKYAINNELIMGPVLIRCTKASTMMTNLVVDDFLAESILVPPVEEQQKIGAVLNVLDTLIALHQRKHEKLKQIKQALLEKVACIRENSYDIQ